jgi:S-adenosyl methyltransferase
VSESPPPSRPTVDQHPFHVDPRSSTPERLYSYMTGGDTHFAADRELAEKLTSISPDAMDRSRTGVRAMGAFMTRVVRYLTREAGIRQFLSAGAGVPGSKNAHNVAQELAPESRVVYVTRDPVVVAHAHKLGSTPEGAAALVYRSLRREPDRVLEEAALTLDLRQPVAFLLLGYLNFVTDERDPYGLVDRLLGAVPPGSYLAIAHTTADFNPAMVEGAERLAEFFGGPFVLRDRAEISRFLTGLELVPPGLVHIDRWREHENKPVPDAEHYVALYGAVGRKPSPNGQQGLWGPGG